MKLLSSLKRKVVLCNRCNALELMLVFTDNQYNVKDDCVSMNQKICCKIGGFLSHLNICDYLLQLMKLCSKITSYFIPCFDTIFCCGN